MELMNSEVMAVARGNLTMSFLQDDVDDATLDLKFVKCWPVEK